MNGMLTVMYDMLKATPGGTEHVILLLHDNWSKFSSKA